MTRSFIPSTLVLLAMLACTDQVQQDIPNRVLDRPTDVALVCAVVECNDLDGDGVDDAGECVTQALPLSVCQTDSGSCSSDNPHLVGFVANSERNEIAMFAKCANRLIDMNIETPGYNFIPAGILPTDLAASTDGCRVVSANVGSCDLTLLDAPALAGFALDNSDSFDEPSSLVSTLVPQTYDPGEDAGDGDGDGASGYWRPLGARPGQVIAVPSNLTQAPGLAPGQSLSGICDPLVRAGVYVSFPTCNLVAELDLHTGHVLQSRQFVSDGQGGVSVVDRGVTPTCPVECPVQFDGELPPILPAVDQDGPFPQALELSLESAPPTEDPEPGGGAQSSGYDSADEAIEGQRLFVGGLGSDIVFEIPIGDTGLWGPLANQLQLSDAGGVKGIRVSPGVNPSVHQSDFTQFLYVVAGDGSTRVVGRTLPADDDSVGVECETQLDPSLVATGSVLACTPVSQSPSEGPPAERRGFSRGPGIRPGRGEEVTDWMFRKIYAGESGTGPFKQPGTVAVGVTTGGNAVYVMLNQARASGETTPEDLGGIGTDPANIMDVRLLPHSLWPDPSAESPLGLPVVRDETPSRVVPGGSGPTRTLSPSLRRVDATYFEDERALAQLNVVADYDKLGGGVLYDEDVARVAVHDYRSWGSSNGAAWSLEWEGSIQSTQSTTGRLDCANPGWEDGTCLVQYPNDARLFDSSANFCDSGVLPGDKVVIIGCYDDDDCGDGRRCLRESAAGGQSTGICVSGEDYDARAADLREICGNFISDPCGEAYREFRITQAAQGELWLQAMDPPLISHLVDIEDLPKTPEDVPDDPDHPEEVADHRACLEGSNTWYTKGDCRCLPGFSFDTCGPGSGALECCPDSSTLLPGQANVVEVEGHYVCTDEQPDGGCSENDDCAEGTCIDSLCRLACDPSDPSDQNCVRRRLPGPACFGEFVRYQVALNNAFRVSGPGISFVTDLVEVDPDPPQPVDPSDPATPPPPPFPCRETVDTEISRLLTSRLPLPASDDPDDPDWLAIPTCVSDNVSPSNANPCRVVATRALLNKFHQFEYEGQVSVSALRFSNPVFSIVLDLAALEGLTADVPGYEDAIWPASFASFHRSRIPRGYRQEFALDTGYAAFADILTLEGRRVTYPVRIVPGPRSEVAYIVDGSGPGSSTSIRGQVVRVTLGEQVAADEAFIGVR